MWIIYLLSFGITITILIISAAYFIGNWQAKQDYKKDLKVLELGARNGLIDLVNYERIKLRFKDILRYKCVDVLYVNNLKKEFESRFDELFVTEDEHSPENLDYDKTLHNLRIHKEFNNINQND